MNLKHIKVKGVHTLQGGKYRIKVSPSTRAGWEEVRRLPERMCVGHRVDGSGRVVRSEGGRSHVPQIPYQLVPLLSL